MHSMLPSLRPEARANDSSSRRPEFDAAVEALRAAWKLRDPRLITAEGDLASGRVEEARRVLEKMLAQRPRNPDALNLMAEIAGREGRDREAEHLLARCVQSAPAIE